MTQIQLLLFYGREASKPYLLKGPSIKQYKMAQIHVVGVRQSALGSILGCAPGVRRALFWSWFSELAEALAEIIFQCDFNIFFNDFIGFLLVLGKSYR